MFLFSNATAGEYHSSLLNGALFIVNSKYPFICFYGNAETNKASPNQIALVCFLIEKNVYQNSDC